jgi:putative membrane protein
MVPLLPLLHVGASLSASSFTVHWSTAVGLVALAVSYEWRAARGSRARASGEPQAVSRQQRAVFYGALLTIFFSLNGWLHDLSDWYLFSAHMVQHLLLTLLMPPLLLAGVPGWMLRPVIETRPFGAIARALTRPKICFATFNVVLAFWHLPQFYNAAVADHRIHILQHLMFMAAAVMLWWPILSQLPELPRLSYPMQMLYLFLTTLPMSIVAVYITYSRSLLYPGYSAAPRILGITPMQDQLIGGLIMWIPGGLVMFAVITVIFFRWQAHGAEDTAASAQVDWRPANG